MTEKAHFFYFFMLLRYYEIFEKSPEIRREI